MSDALSGLLPIATAIAISPIPILAVILMLLSDRATENALAFLIGWALALALICGFVALIGAGSTDAAEDPAPALIAAQFAIAGALLLGAIRRFRKRPRPGEPHETPRWVAGVRSIGPARALALGIGLIALNPKDGLLTVAAGARLAAADTTGTEGLIALAIFVAVASVTIAAPIAATVIAGPRAAPILERSRTAIERHGQVAVAAVLAVLGVAVALGAIGEL